MTKRQTDPIERFTSRFSRSTPDECWEWTGSRLPSGYGMFWPYGREGGKHYAHRFSYEHFVGPIPDEHQVDHLCSNPPCVNPAHLEPVSGVVNNRRANGWRLDDDGLWRCRLGHLMPEESVSVGTCRECFNDYRAGWRSGKQRNEASQTYMARWSRDRRMRDFAAEHPRLEREAEQLGLALCRRRLSAGWTYGNDGWTDLKGRLIPFGTGPLRT